MPEFFETRMGRNFYEHSVPRIANELKRLNDLLERIVGLIESGPAKKTERNIENEKD